MLILAILFLGIIIGMKIFPIKYSKINERIQIVLILALIFCLGVGVGLRPNLLSELSTMGVQSFLLSFFPALFSVLLVYVVEKFIIHKKRKNKNEEE